VDSEARDGVVWGCLLLLLLSRLLHTEKSCHG